VSIITIRRRVFSMLEMSINLLSAWSAADRSRQIIIRASLQLCCPCAQNNIDQHRFEPASIATFPYDDVTYRNVSFYEWIIEKTQ
jgi:hypothetical protein